MRRIAVALMLLAACGSAEGAVPASPPRPTELPPEAVVPSPTSATSLPPAVSAAIARAAAVSTTAEAPTTVPTTAEAPTTTEPEPPPVPQPPPLQTRPRWAGSLVGRIVIPKLGIDAPMREGVDMTTLDLGPGYWPGSALPGRNGNLVVAGHRTSHTKPFRYIDQLEPGDEVLFDVDGVQHRYVMSGHEIVTPDRVDIINPTSTPTATLFACHPPGSTRYRYVVRLDLVP
jgi:sortase A